MFRRNDVNARLRSRSALSLLLMALLSCAVHAQTQTTPEEKNALVDYGEHHPLVFIGAIFLVVLIAVVVVYFIFKRTNKQASTPAAAGGFSKPAPRTGRHPADRRYMGKKSIPR